MAQNPNDEALRYDRAAMAFACIQLVLEHQGRRTPTARHLQTFDYVRQAMDLATSYDEDAPVGALPPVSDFSPTLAKVGAALDALAAKPEGTEGGSS